MDKPAKGFLLEAQMEVGPETKGGWIARLIGRRRFEL